MLLQHLQPFQVDPDRVNQQEIAKLVNKISTTSKVSEIQENLIEIFLFALIYLSTHILTIIRSIFYRLV